MNFYITIENNSGIKTNSKQEFFEYLNDFITSAENNSKEYFSITIEKDE